MASSNPRAVVTGASGHLGYHVARRLRDSEVAVDLLVRRVNENVVDLVQRGARHHLVNWDDPASFAARLRDADCLFHLAAENTTRQTGRERILQSTAGLTESLLTTAMEQGVRIAVCTSSVVVLGRSADPGRLMTERDRATVHESPYVQGKAAAEAWCARRVRERGWDLRRVYPSWVVGPNDPRGTPPHQVVNRFLRQPQAFYFDGGISITSVESVAQGHVAAWQRGKAGETYVLGGENITFRDFFALLAEFSGVKPPAVRLPKGLILLGAHVLKALMRPLGLTPPVDPQYVRTVIGQFSWYDSTKAVRELGYRIPPVRDCLQRAVLGERKRLAGTYSLGRPKSLHAVKPASQREEMPPLLLTGVPGWLGNRFVERFINGDPTGQRPPPRRIRLLVEPRHVALLDLPPAFEIAPGDICDPEAVHRALADIKTVFHLAGAIYPPRIATLYRVNAEGTRNLVDQCLRRGVRRILYMSTDSLCGHGRGAQRIFDEHTPDRPYRHYERSKGQAERYLLDKTAAGQIDGTSLRGFWFFGPGAPARQQAFLNLMRWRRQLVFGNGRNYRSVSHVDNVVSAFLAAETAPATFGKWYWIGDLKADYTVDEICARLCAGCGNRYRPLHVPRFVCTAMRGVDAFLAACGRLHPTIHGIGKFSFDIAGRVDAAQRDFGYAPVTSLAEYAAHAYDEP